MSANRPASDVYEIQMPAAADSASPLRRAFAVIAGLFSSDDRSTTADDRPMIISVRHKPTGDEVFRHIEDLNDDESHMLQDLRRDLASMTATEFADRWAG